MTRPMRLGPVGVLGVQLGGDPDAGEGNEPHDCCDPTPPPDRALESEARVPSSPAAGGIVQIAEAPWLGGGVARTATFAATPANGNTMYAFVFTEGEGPSVIDTAGWSQIELGEETVNGDIALWSKVAGAAEPTAVHVQGGPGGWARRLVIYEVAGSHDVSDALSDQPRTSPLVGPTLMPGGTSGVLIAAFFSRTSSTAPDPTQTPQGALQTDTFDAHNPGRGNAWTGHQDTTTGSYTPTLATTPLYSGTLTASVAVIVDATPTPTEWNIPAPKTVDGDDETYETLDWMPWTPIESADTPAGRVFRAVDTRHEYMEVPLESVPLLERRAASAAVAFAVRDLALEPIEVHWFAPYDGENPVVFRAGGLGRYVAGRTRAGRHRCFWLCRGIGPQEVAGTVLHELRHVRWSIDHGLQPDHRYHPEERAATEAAADDYRAEHRRLIEAMARPDWPSNARGVNRAGRRRRAA